MPVLLPVDHRATFAGWAAQRPKSNRRSWSDRRGLGVFVIIALASWVVVLSPLLLLD